MPTLHVIDPLLKHAGGHYLGQHQALWQLCQSAGFHMIIYCHNEFTESQAPDGVKVHKVFSDYSGSNPIDHCCVTLGISNQSCFEDLKNIDVSSFKLEDVLFLTSATAERVVAYGHWLRSFIEDFGGRLGIYTTVSSEIDDTMGRSIRRDGIEISEESFSKLDDVVITNELKCSMYRYLFDSLPTLASENVKVFYEEPFPNPKYLELCRNPNIEFTYLHSMYPGTDEGRMERTQETLTITYLGSGGVGDDNKGHHLLGDIIDTINGARSNIDFNIHLGKASKGGVDDDLVLIKKKIEQHTNVSVFMGLLDCNQYSELLEKSDIVIMPYGPRYGHIMSGVFDDCLFLGIPCVIPKQSKMALWLDRHNVNFSSFNDWDAASISSAIDQVIDRYDYFYEQFQHAQKICRIRWETRNPFTVFGIPLKLAKDLG